MKFKPSTETRKEAAVISEDLWLSLPFSACFLIIMYVTAHTSKYVKA